MSEDGARLALAAIVVARTAPACASLLDAAAGAIAALPGLPQTDRADALDEIALVCAACALCRRGQIMKPPPFPPPRARR